MSAGPASMRAQPRWFWPAWWPIGAGVAWLALGWRAGVAPGLFATLPGALMLAPGVALLLWPGDRQISHYMALGGFAGVFFALPMALLAGWLPALLLAGLGAASYLTAGYAALYQMPATAGVPSPDIHWRMARKVALDEALLAYFVGSAGVPTGARVTADAGELFAARDAANAGRWTERRDMLHPEPPPPDDAALRATRAGGQQFLHLRFDSGYQPHPDLPGGDRWQAYEANRRAHAWVFRHADGPRPWLMGVHGYRMGAPWVDFSLFRAAWLHHHLGLNVVLPILPLHGPRRAYRRSGTGFLDGPMVDVIHAECQAMWDLRRTLAWIRRQEPAARIGVLGFSLGGYNAALLATLESDLACVMAGIPLTDVAEVIWRHLPLLHLRYLESCGVTAALARQALAPVSPLHALPRVAPDRRFVFAAVADQLVPPSQALQLAAHWGVPDPFWYQGSHLSVRREASVQDFIADSLMRSGLVADGVLPSGCPRPAEAGK